MAESAVPAAPPAVPSKPSLRSLARSTKSMTSVSTIRATVAVEQQPPSPAETQVPPATESQRPKSKLSALASSRSSLRSKSSASSFETSGSIATYPRLRPTAESVVSLKSEGSVDTNASSMSSHVRRAIETALQQEGVDSHPQSPRATLPQSPSRAVSQATATVKSPIPREPSLTRELAPSPKPPSAAPASPQPPQSKSLSSSSAGAEGQTRRQSKLSELAQAKAKQGQNNSPWMPKSKRSAPEIPNLMVQKSHTEYLTPIANGPTATTAITTSYQTLASLARPSRSDPSAINTVNMFGPKHSRSPGEPKQSKLAMKSKKAKATSEPELEPELEPALSALDLPMFRTLTSQSRASPSAFAALLIDDDQPALEAKGKDRKESSRAREHREVVEKPRKKTHRRTEVPVPPGLMSPPDGFAFDVPSPDDVVFSARRGTSLAQRSSTTTSRVAHSSASHSSSRPSSLSHS